MKYKVSKKVHGYRYKGKRYLSGSIVELPDGVNVPDFLEPIVEVKAPVFVTTNNEPKVEVSLSVAPDAKATLSESLEDLSEPPKRRRRVQ